MKLQQPVRPQPVGYRFYPTEEELVSFYLRNKLDGRNEEDMHRVIPVLDIYEKEPSDLPRLAGEMCREDAQQWFFFARRQERETNGGRISRSTASGYWKSTGSRRYVYSSDHRAIAVKKSMVFYEGRAPRGRKTKWKMNEYKAIGATMQPTIRHEFSVCRVYVESRSLRAFNLRPPREAAVSRVDERSRKDAAEANVSGGEMTCSYNRPESPRPLEDLSSISEELWNWEQLEVDSWL
ncbi:hypothetical protein SAY86_031481 [Trapa natans]|uniref:NAC domain-containing protein n=1 Tax=Trapa natans TaxID=22666 RepID=A0AAN7LLZ6_TRANT|nr:hypothetical protein SAY86_031481 [Trapa natans]